MTLHVGPWCLLLSWVGGKAEVVEDAWEIPRLGEPAGVPRPGPSPPQAAPHTGPPPAPLPLPWREEETRRPSPGLPTVAAASPAPSPPCAASRTSWTRGEKGSRGGRSRRLGICCGPEPLTRGTSSVAWTGAGAGPDEPQTLSPTF